MSLFGINHILRTYGTLCVHTRIQKYSFEISAQFIKPSNNLIMYFSDCLTQLHISEHFPSVYFQPTCINLQNLTILQNLVQRVGFSIVFSLITNGLIFL